jgi:hypothetical protein
MAAMLAGFVGVPLFKFGATALPGVTGVFFAELSELPPAFLLSFMVGIIFSLGDRAGQERLADIGDELTAGPSSESDGA